MRHRPRQYAARPDAITYPSIESLKFAFSILTSTGERSASGRAPSKGLLDCRDSNNAGQLRRKRGLCQETCVSSSQFQRKRDSGNDDENTTHCFSSSSSAENYGAKNVKRYPQYSDSPQATSCLFDRNDVHRRRSGRPECSNR